MLDDRAAGFAIERIGGEEGALQIEQIVEGKLLAALLLERGDPVVPALDVERGALSGVLAIAEARLLLQRNRDAFGKNLRALTTEPIRDGGVVSGCAREYLLRQQSSQIEIIVARFEGGEYPRVVCRIDDDEDRREVLRRRPQHRRASDVDLLDHV